MEERITFTKPIPRSDIEKAEQTLGIKLPPSYVDFVTRYGTFEIPGELTGRGSGNMTSLFSPAKLVNKTRQYRKELEEEDEDTSKIVQDGLLFCADPEDEYFNVFIVSSADASGEMTARGFDYQDFGMNDPWLESGETFSSCIAHMADSITGGSDEDNGANQSSGNAAAASKSASKNDFVIEGGVLKKYSGNDSKVTIPPDLGITEIGRLAFCDSTITEIALPEGLVSIGDAAFCRCRRLHSVVFPTSLKAIIKDAFSGCLNLGSVIIPSKVTTIAARSFYDCKTLASVTLPNGLKSIEEEAFSECKKLRSIIIPDSVTSIGKEAFKECGLKSIVIPKGASIGEGAFKESGLKSVTMLEGVTSIGEKAFNCCRSLEAVTIPKGITTIEFATFGSCKALQSVILPDTVEEIRAIAFAYCTSLASINIPQSVKSIADDAFKGCERLELPSKK